MEYIKHKDSFYKKVELEELDKKELIKLITEAIEIEPKIIERRSSYPVYVEKYPQWKDTLPYYISGTTVQGITAVSNQSMSSLAGDKLSTNLNSMDTSDLINLCISI